MKKLLVLVVVLLLCTSFASAGFLDVVTGMFAKVTGNAVAAESYQATWRLLIDVKDAANDPIVGIDIYDSTANQVLASRTVYRSEFLQNMIYQDFSLDFNYVPANVIEFRTYWAGASYTALDKIIIKKNGVVTKTWESTDPSIRHSIGRQDGVDWSVNTAADSPGFMSFGPYFSCAEISDYCTSTTACSATAGVDVNSYCSSACGAGAGCQADKGDLNGEGQKVKPLDLIGYCAKGGYSGIHDRCSSNCQPEDRPDGVCRKIGIVDCTGDEKCELITAGTNNCNASCGYVPSCTQELSTPGNLVANKGFESISDSSSWAKSSAHAVASDKAHSGCYALKSTFNNQAGSSGAATHQTASVAPTAVYKLSGYIYKTTGAGAAYLDLSDIPGECTATANQFEQWQYVECQFTASTNYVTVRLVTDLVQDSTKPIWFDDIQILKMGSIVLPCVEEGQSIPVVANKPSCCSGLALIPPKAASTVGSYGICTAKCGNGVCDSATETSYNCPKDCSSTSFCFANAYHDGNFVAGAWSQLKTATTLSACNAVISNLTKKEEIKMQLCANSKENWLNVSVLWGDELTNQLAGSYLLNCNFCIDSDGGSNYYSKGSVEYWSGVEPYIWYSHDSCSYLSGNLTSLTEYYCENDLRKQTSYVCPSGCKDGACVKDATTACTDSDGGIELYKTGTVTMSSAVCQDRCSTDAELANSGGRDSLLECFCGTGQPSGGGQGSGWYYCPNGCVNGACVENATQIQLPTPQASTIMCTDTDGSRDYYTQGSANGCDGFSVTSNCAAIADSCLDSLRLREAFCDSGVLVYADIQCPGSCSDGACVYEEAYPSSEQIKIIASEEVFVNQEQKPSETAEPSPVAIPAEEITPAALGCDNGCFNGDKCLSYGYRLRGSYCDVSGQMKDQLKAGSGCDNNFECSTNTCVNSQCVSAGLIEKFIEWFNQLFGGA